ncbi:aminoglycoside phosphotransferase family protein [Streptomyces sp. NPDC093085]|uniref:aminoglycoside phosphotransferase family protein n=1 Tax=Streptomyces sp. NPDC093085 TaxID=3155068 RepID=UPI003438BDA1
MRASEVARAVTVARALVASYGLPADGAAVLHNSNKLTLRLLPCDVLARVAPAADRSAYAELDLARRLAGAGCPVAAPDPRTEPRVHERDGFVVTLWTYYAPLASPEVPPAAYAHALARLHAGMRTLDAPAAGAPAPDLPVPHVTDRIEQARRLVADRERTPALAAADRELLGDTLRSLRRTVTGHGGPEQLLHGEPHPGNLLATADGPLFIDFETCCRGPVAFDLAHAPDEAAAFYPEVDEDLLRACRLLVLTLVTTWRWDRHDQFPDGRRMGTEWLDRIRAARA